MSKDASSSLIDTILSHGLFTNIVLRRFAKMTNSMKHRLNNPSKFKRFTRLLIMRTVILIATDPLVSKVLSQTRRIKLLLWLILLNRIKISETRTMCPPLLNQTMKASCLHLVPSTIIPRMHEKIYLLINTSD